MAIKLPDVHRQSQADDLIAYIGNAAILRIYSGTQPANADAAITGTLLAELNCASPFAGAASSEGVVTASAITQDSSANATGTATHFRLFQSNGTTVVMDGAVSTSGAELNLVSTSITATEPVQVSSFVVTIGGA